MPRLTPPPLVYMNGAALLRVAPAKRGPFLEQVRPCLHSTRDLAIHSFHPLSCAAAPPDLRPTHPTTACRIVLIFLPFLPSRPPMRALSLSPIVRCVRPLPHHTILLPTQQQTGRAWLSHVHAALQATAQAEGQEGEEDDGGGGAAAALVLKRAEATVVAVLGAVRLLVEAAAVGMEEAGAMQVGGYLLCGVRPMSVHHHPSSF